MELSVTSTAPAWAQTVGTSYETKFLYTGLGRIDAEAQVYQAFQHGPPFLLFERPFKGGVVSRVYTVEFATVTVYSKSPRCWKEETPTDTLYFTELRKLPQ
jgi:hypothetical protein